MNGYFDTSRQKEEEERIVSALHHVISGGIDENYGTLPSTQIEHESFHRQHHHHHHPMLVWEGPPQTPPVFSTGESSSTSTNRLNTKKKKKKSGKTYRGVRQRGSKWVAEIWDPHQGKVQWLSSFATAEEAARAYDRKAIEYRGVDGAFPYTNFPLEDYLYPNPSYLGTNNNAPTVTAHHVVPVAGPGLSSSTFATANESAPPNNSNNAAEEEDPLLLLDDFDDETLQQFMALATSL